MPHHTSRPRPLALTLAVAFALAAQLGQESQPALRSKFRSSNPRACFPSHRAALIKTPVWPPPMVLEGSPETELIMRGDAEIRRGGIVIKGDKLTYTQATDIVQAEGNADLASRRRYGEAPRCGIT